MRTGLLRILTGAAVAASVSAPMSLWACATCFGASDSPMAKGMNMGIFTLLFVILSVLVGIAAFFFYIIRRAAKIEATNHSATLSQDRRVDGTMAQPTQ